MSGLSFGPASNTLLETPPRTQTTRPPMKETPVGDATPQADLLREGIIIRGPVCTSEATWVIILTATSLLSLVREESEAC